MGQKTFERQNCLLFIQMLIGFTCKGDRKKREELEIGVKLLRCCIHRDDDDDDVAGTLSISKQFEL
jgi:hypothetical protein